MSQDVIKEFLVSLAYKIDGASQKRFESGLAGATKAALTLGAVVASAGAAVSVAAAKIGKDLDELYFQAQRTSAGAQSIRAMGYAVSQLGGSYAGATASIEAFARNVRTNPGYESMARQLGVVTRQNGKLRDTVDIIRDVGKALSSKPYYVQVAYANAFGIDEATWRAIQSGDLSKRMDEYKAKARAMGVDLDEASRRGNAFWTAMRSLSSTLDVVGQKLANDVLPSLTPFVQKIDEFLQKNADKIVEAIRYLGEAFQKLGEWAAKAWEYIQPLLVGFDKWSKELTGANGLTVAIAAIIGLKLAGWLLGVAASIAAVGSASNAAMMGGALGKFFRLLGVGAVGAAAAAPLLGGATTGADHMRRMETDPAYRADQDKFNSGQGGLIGSVRKGWGKVKSWWNGTSEPELKSFPGRNFAEKAPKIMEQLQHDLGLTREQAAGIMGNLGHESGGLTQFQEKNPLIAGSRGGWGWAQWTGPRRRAFERWAAEKGLDPKSDEANYGFLVHELKGPERRSLEALKRTRSPEEATMVFERSYERAGIKHDDSRVRWTARALRAAEQADARQKAEAAVPLPKTSGLASTMAPYNVPLSPMLRQRLEGNPLMAPVGSESTINMQQKTDITVIGSSDPAGTAAAVADQQRSVNGGLQRNIQRAVQ